MTIALEIAAGMVLTTALVTGMTILAALELGRMVTMDDEQREVEARPAEPPTLGCAARYRIGPRWTAGWLARVQQLAPVVATEGTIDVNLFAMEPQAP